MRTRMITGLFIGLLVSEWSCKAHRTGSAAKNIGVIDAEGNAKIIYGDGVGSLKVATCGAILPLKAKDKMDNAELKQLLKDCQPKDTATQSVAAVKATLEAQVRLVYLGKEAAPDVVKTQVQGTGNIDPSAVKSEQDAIDKAISNFTVLKQILKDVESDANIPEDAPIMKRLREAEQEASRADSRQVQVAGVQSLSAAMNEFIETAASPTTLLVVNPYSASAKVKLYNWLAERFVKGGVVAGGSPDSPKILVLNAGFQMKTTALPVPFTLYFEDSPDKLCLWLLEGKAFCTPSTKRIGGAVGAASVNWIDDRNFQVKLVQGGRGNDEWVDQPFYIQNHDTICPSSFKYSDIECNASDEFNYKRLANSTPFRNPSAKTGNAAAPQSVINQTFKQAIPAPAFMRFYGSPTDFCYGAGSVVCSNPAKQVAGVEPCVMNWQDARHFSFSTSNGIEQNFLLESPNVICAVGAFGDECPKDAGGSRYNFTRE